MEQHLPEEQLIEYVKPYLKAKGFKKKNKRWTKDIGDFTVCFYIQGSCFSKEKSYVIENILGRFFKWCLKHLIKTLLLILHLKHSFFFPPF